MSKCLVDLCSALSCRKGMCDKHYRQVKKYGVLRPDLERELGFDNSKHELYPTWIMMKDRCNNPNNGQYKYYGGRGICVCDLWQNSFQAFISDMGGRPLGYSLDRLNSNGNYEPSNCRWATDNEQALNRRMRCTNTVGTNNIHQNKKGDYVVRRFHPATGERVYLGTFKTLDEAKKAQSQRGRPNVVGTKGVNNPHAKLTEKDVSDIRKELSKGVVQRRLAEQYGVTPTVICNIKNGKIWN